MTARSTNTVSASVGLLCIAAVACGGDRPPAPPAADAGPTDAAVDSPVPTCPGFPAGATGSRCASDADCLLDGAICFDEGEGYLVDGYCTRACEADADCGGGAFCAELVGIQPGDAGPPESLRLCVARCCDGAACPDGLLCQSIFAGFADIGGPGCMPGDPDARDGDACEGAFACNVDSVCLASPETPGGYCTTIGCTVGDDRTCAPGGDAVCGRTEDLDRGFCVDTCSSDADCRGAEGYRCEGLGAGGVCAHAQVADTCRADVDCGLDPWVCRPAAEFPGGHCTVPCTAAEDECGGRAICHEPAGGGTPSASPCARSAPTTARKAPPAPRSSAATAACPEQGPRASTSAAVAKIVEGLLAEPREVLGALSQALGIARVVPSQLPR